MTLELLPSTAEIVRLGDRFDRFTRSLPAYKAASVVKAEVTLLTEQLDLASQAKDAELFDVFMTAAECSTRRIQGHLATLQAEIKKGAA